MQRILTPRWPRPQHSRSISAGATRSGAASGVLLALAVGAQGCAPEPAPTALSPIAPAPAAPLQGPSPAARGMEIRGALEDARSLWEGGDRPAARDRVLVAYQQSFEPMEPLLRSVNPDETFALEFAFGALAAQLARRGDPLSTQAQINDINSRVDTLIRSVPAEALPPEAKVNEELLGPPPTAVEVRPPQRDMRTYGEAER